MSSSEEDDYATFGLPKNPLLSPDQPAPPKLEIAHGSSDARVKKKPTSGKAAKAKSDSVVSPRRSANAASSPASGGLLDPKRSLSASARRHSVSEDSSAGSGSVATVRLSHRRVRSTSGSVIDETMVLPFRYEGLCSCELVEILVPTGAPVINGCEVAIVELSSHEMEDDLPGYMQSSLNGDSDGYSDSDIEEAGGNYLQEDDSNSLISDVSVREVDGEDMGYDEKVVVLVWRGNDGVLQEWLVEEGAVIMPNQIVAQIKGSARLAHLIQADQYAQQIRSERTDWALGLNARFQKLTENLVRAIASGSRAVVHSDATLQTCNDLERVARDFMDTARTYGKIIISEMHLPVEAKTVRPLKMGGVLGGSKYVVRDVLFKLGNGALFSEYPDPLYIANKIQGHELKGLKAYFAYFFNAGSLHKVSFPLMTILDYKGHRITAMSELPILGEQSLILGSMNAGGECDVMQKDAAFSELINRASSMLGLKPHYVTNGKSAGGEVEVTHCVDLEGHLGKDGKKYLLDFSRTFPPAYKHPENRAPYDKYWPFYNMFRVEFLKQFQVFNKLSPDAFSKFQSTLHPTERTQNHEDIKTATTFLTTQVVQNVCNALRDRAASADDPSTRQSLTHVLHREGLNMRYLGLVYAKLVERYEPAMRNVYKEIIAEALSRVLKNHLRCKLRAADVESHQLSVAKDILNAFFGKSSNELDWISHNAFVLSQLVSHFCFTPKSAHHCVVTFRSNCNIHVSSSTVFKIKFIVLQRLTEATGLEVDPEVMMDLRTEGSVRGRAFASEIIFEDLDFSFSERVKQLDVVQRAFGLAQYLKGVQAMHENLGASEQFFLRGYFMVEKALESSPLDPWLTGLMADLSSELWMILSTMIQRDEVRISRLKDGPEMAALHQGLQEAREVVDIFCMRAEKHYAEAISASPIVSVLRNHAIFLLRQNKAADAREQLKIAQRVCDQQGAALSEELIDEWELVAEIQDLLKECEDMLHGGLRKPSIQVGSIPLATKPPDRRLVRQESRPLHASIHSRFMNKLRRTADKKHGKGPSERGRLLSSSRHKSAEGSEMWRTDSSASRLDESSRDALLKSSRNKHLLQRLKGGHSAAE